MDENIRFTYTTKDGTIIDQLITDLDDIADYVSMKIGPA